MDRLSILRRGTIGLLLTLLAAAALLTIFVAALDAGYFRAPLLRMVSARVGRRVDVQGSLHLNIFSQHPQLIAEQVSIGNPPWTPAGISAQIGKVTLVLQRPSVGHLFSIDRLELDNATLHLLRDSTGHANWQMKNPDQQAGKGPPLIRSLSVSAARVHLEDALRHVNFEGTVSAQDAPAAQGPPPLRIEGSGELNGKPVTLELHADPLAGASRDKPYHFTFEEHSSGSRLTGSGFLLNAFDMKEFDATFAATGADLRDLYYLTGVTLLNTGPYKLSGKLARRGTHSQVSELAVTFGQSDVRGSVSVERSGGHQTLDANLNSQLVRSVDLGLRAAGREPQTAASAEALLLPDTMLDPAALRRQDAAVNFQARRVEVGRQELSSVSAKLTLQQGALAVTGLSAVLMGGKLSAHIKIDLRTDLPTAELDLKISELQIGQFNRKDSAPASMEGPLNLRVHVTGHGKSIHQVAASADGTVTATLQNGTIRDSLAELAGVDLHGLGLMLEKSKKETAVRCAVASFVAHEGTLTAQSLLLDTEPVLITGTGLVRFESETLDLALSGQPKKVRVLRLRAPIAIRGTLKHPTFAIQTQDAKFMLIDRHLANDVDCAALLAAHP
jgi:AsmA family protein